MLGVWSMFVRSLRQDGLRYLGGYSVVAVELLPVTQHGVARERRKMKIKPFIVVVDAGTKWCRLMSLFFIEISRCFQIDNIA